MGASENKALVRRLFEEGMNGRKAEIFNECVAANFINHDLPGPTPGPERFLQSFGLFEAAFPDLEVHLDEVLAAEDDKVITRSHCTGTHQGEIHGRGGLGHLGCGRLHRHLEDRDGLLAESWVRMDFLGLMQQVGSVPS
jgi:predicted ester cyclase